MASAPAGTPRASNGNTATKRPNFLLIVADDLGFSDLGCFGGEMKTPNIDKLAKNGLRFTDFHSAPMCSPTRSMIMTGTDCHIAGLGNLVESVALNMSKHGGSGTALQRGMPGYEGYLNESVVALPEILQDAGYHTLMSGKWHLGMRPEHSPAARGFDRSFSHMQAASNHFGFEPQLAEGEDGPVFCAMQSYPIHLDGKEWVEQLPEGWYSSNGYGDIMLNYLKDWKKDGASDKPFFAYFPFTAPHWPLQVPQKYSQKYKGMYDDGPEALRQRRLAKLKEQGLVPHDVEAHPVVADEVPTWEAMTDEQRAKSARVMEVFAGMVDCIDENVGKVTSYLEEIGELDNTFICFLSDNGAEGAAWEAYPSLGTNMLEFVAKYYDNSLDNIGNYNSYAWYGPRWAQASTAPSRLYKAFTTEGGIRVPFVLKLPEGVETKNLPADGILPGFSTVMDLAPTILQLAGVQHPAPSYQGREVAHMRGKSMLPYLSGQTPSIHPLNATEGWEIAGKSAVRNGSWKVVWTPPPKGPGRWELFDLSVDPGEIHDLGSSHPQKLKEMLILWEEWRRDVGVIALHKDQGNVLDLMEEQMTANGWMEYEYWKKGAKPGQPTQQNFFCKPTRLPRPANY